MVVGDVAGPSPAGPAGRAAVAAGVAFASGGACFDSFFFASTRMKGETPESKQEKPMTPKHEWEGRKKGKKTRKQARGRKKRKDKNLQ